MRIWRKISISISEWQCSQDILENLSQINLSRQESPWVREGIHETAQSVRNVDLSMIVRISSLSSLSSLKTTCPGSFVLVIVATTAIMIDDWNFPWNLEVDIAEEHWNYFLVWLLKFSMKPWGRYCRRALAETLGSSLPSSGQCGDSQPGDFILIFTTNHFVKHSVHARFQMAIYDKMICNDAYL